MNRERAKEPTLSNIFVWALQRLSNDDYHFSAQRSQDGSGWELTIRERPDENSAEQMVVFKKLGKAIVDGQIAPEVPVGGASGENQVLPYLQSSWFKAGIGFSLLEARRRLGASKVARFEDFASKEAPQELSDIVASGLLLEMANMFPKMIKRAEELRVLGIDCPVRNEVQQYAEEFSRCYIFGRFPAALLVCRAAIELALRDFLTRNGKAKELSAMDEEEKSGLLALIKCARSLNKWKVLPTLDDADEVRRKAIAVAHRGEINPELCKNLIIKTRGVLKELYS
jgi:hypothetical protein